MEQETNKTTEGFIRKEINKLTRTDFVFRIIFNILLYVGVTFWLNSIREHASLWLVWPLIIVQLLLFFWIFTKGYMYMVSKGLNKSVAFTITIIFAVLGRINDWEILAMPCFILISLLIHRKTKIQL